MPIREWTEDDRPAVRALLDPEPDPLWANQGNGLHGPARDGERWRRSFVAEADGRVVGAVTVARNHVHPGRYSCAVEVGPAFRRRGLGAELVDHARRVRPEPLPLAGKLRERDPAGVALLARFGGTSYARSPCPVVDPADPRVLTWSAAQAGAAVLLTDRDRDELVTAFADLYRWLHERWSPVGSEQALAEMSGLTVDELDRTVSAAVVRDGRLAAVAFAFRDGAGLEIVAETTRRDEPSGVHALGAAVAAMLQNAAAAGMSRVEFDGHDADPHLAPLIATLPFVSSDPLLLVAIR